MRHRISTGTMLGGNSEEVLLSNNIKFPKALKNFADEFIDTFAVPKAFNGFDYDFKNGVFKVGIEPAYEHDRLEIVAFDLNIKEYSYYVRGIAMGPYGTRILTNGKHYFDYKKKGKVIKFIDKWYDTVKSVLNKDLK